MSFIQSDTEGLTCNGRIEYQRGGARVNESQTNLDISSGSRLLVDIVDSLRHSTLTYLAALGV
jgi:hypothetical protein